MKMSEGPFKFSVPCEPKGKSRPRFNGKFVYSDKRQVNWENMFALYSAEHRPDKPLEGPLSLSILFVLNRPKRLQRKKDHDGLLPCDKKPDLDNCIKSVQDSLNDQGWWHDDAQVARIVTGKAYSEKGMPARIEVQISQMTDPKHRGTPNES
jgi:Holliday junction resolvase RusA-like endonuclease